MEPIHTHITSIVKIDDLAYVQTENLAREKTEIARDRHYDTVESLSERIQMVQSNVTWVQRNFNPIRKKDFFIFDQSGPDCSEEILSTIVRETKEELKHLKARKQILEKNNSLSLLPTVHQQMVLDAETTDTIQDISWYKRSLPVELWDQVIHFCDLETMRSLWPSLTKEERTRALSHLGPEVAFRFVQADPNNYLSLDPANPSRSDQAIVHSILTQKPDLFFHLPKILQKKLSLRMIAFLVGYFDGNRSVCQRLLGINDTLTPLFVQFMKQVPDAHLLLNQETQEEFFLKHPDIRENRDVLFALTVVVSPVLAFLKNHKPRRYTLNLRNFMRFASAPLRKDKDFILKMAKIYCQSLEYADPPLKKNKTWMMAAVQQHGYALCYADAELQKDWDIVFVAVQESGIALQHADAELKKDWTIVMAAVQESPLAWMYADPELQKDFQIGLAAVQQWGYALQYAAPELQKNPILVTEAVRQCGYALRHAAPELRKDPAIVMVAVQRHGRSLRYADPQLQKDRAIVMAAVQRNGLALQYADLELRKDPEIVEAAVRQNPLALEYVSAEVENYWAIVIAAIQKNAKAFSCLTQKLQELFLNNVQQQYDLKSALEA